MKVSPSLRLSWEDHAWRCRQGKHDVAAEATTWLDEDGRMTYELGERFPSRVDLDCAAPSPTTTGVLLADAGVELAGLRSTGVCVEGASVG